MRCLYNNKKIECPYHKTFVEIDNFQCIETCNNYPQSKIKDFRLWKWILKWIDSKAK